METNIALGLFVNSTQLLFRVMGAPPCHNNSLKEEQFNVNNILSICLLMKTFQSTGKMFLPFWKEKHNGERWTDNITVKGIALAWWNESFLVAHIHLFAFAFFKEVSCLPLFRNFHAIFTRNSSELCQLTDLHGHVCSKTEAFPPARLQCFLLRSLICL